MNSLEGFIDRFRGSSNTHYRKATVFRGHGGPINSLAFNTQATLLASGGDDEEVRIWNMQNNTLLQTLADEASRWGQITCLKFLNLQLTSTPVDWLFFGTGRGFFLAYRRPRKVRTYAISSKTTFLRDFEAGFIEHSSKRIFTPGDSVEAFDVASNRHLVVLSSHNGKVKVCNLEGGILTELWSTELLDVIPRSVRFVDGGRMVFIYGMESGLLGDVSVCSSTGAIAIDNMKNGFDLYLANRTTVAREFPIECRKIFVKKSAFGEAGNVLVCGSDHGAVYVYSTSDGAAPLQILKHGAKSQMLQSVETATTRDDHIIASAASTGLFTVAIWKKKTAYARSHYEHTDAHLIPNLILFLVIAYLTLDKWFPPLVEMSHNLTKTYVSRDTTGVSEATVPDYRGSSHLNKAKIGGADSKKLFDVDELLQLRQFVQGEEGEGGTGKT